MTRILEAVARNPAAALAEMPPPGCSKVPVAGRYDVARQRWVVDWVRWEDAQPEERKVALGLMAIAALGPL